jgi:Uncharacterised nucleotidyltransferase
MRPLGSPRPARPMGQTWPSAWRPTSRPNAHVGAAFRGLARLEGIFGEEFLLLLILGASQITRTDASIPHRRRKTIGTLQLDRAAIQILTALSCHDVPALLLKGASFPEWLYRNEGRSYVDVDSLVPRVLWDHAVQVIERLGFMQMIATPAVDDEQDEVRTCRRGHLKATAPDD